MDDKFLRDKINEDDIEVPESLLPENISKLLEGSAEGVKKEGNVKDVREYIGVKELSEYGNTKNMVETADEKAVNVLGKNRRKSGSTLKYIRSCALAAAALIVVLVGTSTVTRLRENGNKTATAAGEDVFEKEGATNRETDAVGDIDMDRTKYDELYDKLVRGNIYRDYIMNDGGYEADMAHTQAAGSADDRTAGGVNDQTTGNVDGSYSGEIESIGSTVNTDSSDEITSDDEATNEEFSKNNDQEEGVSEGNIFITDGKYLYAMKKPDDVYVGERSLAIYSADGGNLSKCSEIQLGVINDMEYVDYSAMYVEQDTLVLTGFAYSGRYYERSKLTFAVIYDISDRTSPRYVNTLTQSGYNVSSRITDGILYLVSWYTPLTTCERREYEKYIPMFDDELTGEDNIYCPEYIGDRSYTVIGSVDLDNPMKYMDTEALVLNPGNMYASRNAIYFLEPCMNYEVVEPYAVWEEIQDDGTATVDGESGKELEDISGETDETVNDDKESRVLDENKTKSKLIKLTIDKGNIDFAGETMVYGDADNQFSFSEYNGYLRLVTTTMDCESWEQSCGLYIFDEELNMVGHIDNLAKGERIRSSRFLGDMVYFVTFRNTDPLFAVDMSDPANPVIVDEIKMSGFSEYLHPYGDGLLFGLGYEADETNGRLENVKMSMYDISNPADIVEADRVQLAAYYSGAMYEHRAILVNAKRNMIGFVVEENVIEKDESGANMTGKLAQIYRLYSYDEEEGFVQHIECVLDLFSYEYPRAVYIRDYLYIFDGVASVYTYELNDYSLLGVTEL